MRISTTLDNELLLTTEVPHDLQHLHITGSEPCNGIGAFGRLFSQKVTEKRYSFWHSIYRPVENITVHVEQDIPWLGFRLMLKHHIHHIVNGSFDSYLKQGQFNFGYCPTIQSSFDLKKNVEYDIFDMFLSREIFDMVGRKDKLLYSFLATADNGRATLLLPNAYWGNIYSQDAIELLMRYPRSEVVAVQVVKSLLESAFEYTDRISLTEDNIEAIYYVRELIKKDVLLHIPIPELAKKCGINTDLLKKGFFQVFRKTPYQYLLYERLKFAKEMLGNTNLSIQTIARKTGFQFDTSFIKAFKKEFHQTPHSWRRNQMSIVVQ